MQTQPQVKRRRKGISVSLTPDKNNHQNNYVYHTPVHPIVPIVISSSKVSQHQQPIQLQQSYVQCIQQQQPLMQNYRVFSSIKPVDNVVRFNYSNVSKQQQIRQAQALDQQLHILNKQIQTRRQTIQHIQNKSVSMITSNVAPVYTRQPYYPTIKAFQPKLKEPQVHEYQSKYTIKQQKKYDSYKPSFLTPQNNLQTQRSYQIQQFQLNRQKQRQIQEKQKQKTQRKNIIQTNQLKNRTLETIPIKTKSPEKLHQNTQKVMIYNKIQNKSPQRKQVQKQKLIYEMDQKIVQKQKNKQNMIKQTQRLQRLKWAQQKLLNIIKICDNGL